MLGRMSEPFADAVTGAHCSLSGSVAGPSNAAPREVRLARGMGRISTLLILLAAGAVVGTTAPAIVRAAGIRLEGPARPRRQVAPQEATLRDLRNSVPGRPALVFDEDDDGHAADPEQRIPNDGRPDWHPHADTREPPTGSDAQTLQAGVASAVSGGKFGVAVAPMMVRRDPSEAAPALGSVAADDALLVLTVTRGWARVMYRDTDGIITGWVPRAGVTISWP